MPTFLKIDSIAVHLEHHQPKRQEPIEVVCALQLDPVRENGSERLSCFMISVAIDLALLSKVSAISMSSWSGVFIKRCPSDLHSA